MSILGKPLPTVRTAAVAAITVVAATALVALPRASADAVPLGLRCHGHRPTIVGTPARDHLVGTRGRDVIVALRGGDVIRGRGGRDLVCAGDGQDRVRATHATHVYAGAGKDRVRTGRTIGGRQLLEGGPGRDTAVLRMPRHGKPSTLHTNLRRAAGRIRGADFRLQGFSRVLVVPGQRHDAWHATGSAADEVFAVIAARPPLRTRMRAAGGDDTIRTSNGRDSIDGGSGDDLANTGGGVDTCAAVEDARGCEMVRP